ncbi:MAG: hypothetical protein IPK97_12135 [Ahniella sp.]|nr:hypothetical protein [Ahniella sp.]
MWQTIKDGWTWAGFFAARLFEALFGEVAWTPPPWLIRWAKRLWRHRLPLAGTLVLALVAVSGWNWWQNRPRIVPP